MPSKKQYNLVHNDEYDTRIPLYSEEAFHRGIVFHAKFIGSMEVSRPTSRVEIVTAMRKIRYEFKAKGTKKKKVTLEVSVDGLKVTLRKKKKKQHWNDDNKFALMHHPIYRIFYVSHDSHDLKIFSYIARDGNGNTFRCNVFKSSKKSQAMRVVRTVGQAFEVCHKLSLNQATEDHDRVNEKDKDTGVESLQDDYDDHHDLAIDPPQQSPTSVHKDISLLDGSEENVDQTSVSCLLRSQDVPTMKTSSSPIRQSPSGTVTSDYGGLHSSSELTALKREVQLLRERLEQQFQQTRAAVAHARLLQEQLAAETATRVEAQARAHQLFVQNKDLLDHISALVEYRGQERMSDDHETPPMQLSSSMNMPQTPTVPDLGQAQQVGNQSSPWEVDPSYPYSYPDSIYVGTSSVSGVKGNHNCSDQLYFQAQLLERLHNISPYQTQRSPYNVASPSTYPIGPGLLLTPMNKPSNPMQMSPGSASLRVSQPSSFSSSPIMPQHEPFRFMEPSDGTTESSFIKPLPCRRRKSVEREVKATMGNNAEEVPTVMLDAPSATRQDYEIPSELATKHKNLQSVLKTPGPPPSRTTSARLPPRHDVKTQMQRTTWARHTTK